MVQAAWEDVPHISQRARDELERDYPPQERDARTRGVPQLGAGAIFPVPESEIIVEPFQFPVFWKHVYALDVGWNRTAALWAAYDSEHDVAYLHSEHYRAQAEPAIHAQAIRARGDWIPGVIDPASRGRSQVDGERLFETYRNDFGLTLTAADNAVEAGLYEMWSRLSTGRLKVFSTLANFRAEYRIYRRDEKGRVIKENDHLMDCGRYICMSGLNIAAFKPHHLSRPGALHRSEYDPYAEKPRQGGHRSNYDPYA